VEPFFTAETQSRKDLFSFCALCICLNLSLNLYPLLFFNQPLSFRGGDVFPTYFNTCGADFNLKSEISDFLP
jgi:hypothetical protein